MSDENVLTKEIAEQFVADEDSVILNEFTAIEDEAAKSLSNHHGGWLYLDGLTSLSDEAAESLSNHHEGWLYLNGLTSLSDAAAESLSRHEGDLSLDGLTSLALPERHLQRPNGDWQLGNVAPIIGDRILQDVPGEAIKFVWPDGNACEADVTLDELRKRWAAAED